MKKLFLLLTAVLLSAGMVVQAQLKSKCSSEDFSISTSQPNLLKQPTNLTTNQTQITTRRGAPMDAPGLGSFCAVKFNTPNHEIDTEVFNYSNGDWNYGSPADQFVAVEAIDLTRTTGNYVILYFWTQYTQDYNGLTGPREGNYFKEAPSITSNCDGWWWTCTSSNWCDIVTDYSVIDPFNYCYDYWSCYGYCYSCPAGTCPVSSFVGNYDGKNDPVPTTYVPDDIRVKVGKGGNMYINLYKDGVWFTIGEPMEYSITYNLNGGTNPVSPAPVTIYTEETNTFSLPTPTKTGYNFEGWYSNSSLTGASVSSIAQGTTGNKEFWAKWSQKTYTAANNIDKNGGASNGQYTATYNATTIAINTAPGAETGYKLEGLYQEAACTHKIADASGNLQPSTAYTDANRKWKQDGNVTLYANWIGKQCTVNLNNQGADTGHEGAANVTATYGSAMPSIATDLPTKNGYRFGGYWTGENGTGTQYYKADGSSAKDWDVDTETAQTLNAQWIELVTLTIAPYTNGTVTVSYTDNGSQSFTSGSSDIPVGTIVTFTFSANPNYHISTVALSKDQVDKGTFSNGASYTLKAGDGTLTLTANFLPDTYAITYNKGANGTGTIAAGEKTYNVNCTLSSSTFTRTGYTQTGWSTEDGGSKAYDLGGTYTANTAVTLYPYWEVNTYDITFKNADGTTLKKSDDTTDAVYSVAYGETPAYDGATPTKAADSEYTYTFNAWTPAIATVTTDATYTATYSTTKVQYTLTWDFAGGVTTSETGDYTNGLIDWGTDITAPANPTKVGFTFTGWNVTPAATMPTNDVTYTAQWESAVTPEIVLNEEGEQHTLGGVATNKTLDELASDYASRDVNVTIDRTLYGGSWNTIVFPFSVEDMEGNVLDGSLYELNTSTTTATSEGMVINFEPLSGDGKIVAGVPYLIRTSANVNLNNYPFNGVRLTSEFSSVTDGDAVDFVPIKEKEKIHYNQENLAIFIVGNRLYYPNKTTGTNLRGFRAYLKIKNGTVYGGPVRIRIADTGETITMDEEQEIETRKYVEDGILIIERGGVRYDAQGKRMDK